MNLMYILKFCDETFINKNKGRDVLSLALYMTGFILFLDSGVENLLRL